MERRDPSRQDPLPGGTRAGDPPFTTRECADWMGVTTEYIRQAIESGQLEAETIPTSGRRVMHRVHLDKFIEYLKRIGWKRIPSLPRNGGAAAIIIQLLEVLRV